MSKSQPLETGEIDGFPAIPVVEAMLVDHFKVPNLIRANNLRISLWIRSHMTSLIKYWTVAGLQRFHSGLVDGN